MRLSPTEFRLPVGSLKISALWFGPTEFKEPGKTPLQLALKLEPIVEILGNRTQTSVAGLGALARLRRATQAIPLPHYMRNMVKVSYGFGQRPMLRVSNITPTLESITKPVPVIVTRQIMGLGATPMRVMVQPVVRRTRFEPETFRGKQSFPGQDWRPPSSNKFEPVSFREKQSFPGQDWRPPSSNKFEPETF